MTRSFFVHFPLLFRMRERKELRPFRLRRRYSFERREAQRSCISGAAFRRKKRQGLLGWAFKEETVAPEVMSAFFLEGVWCAVFLQRHGSSPVKTGWRDVWSQFGCYNVSVGQEFRRNEFLRTSCRGTGFAVVLLLRKLFSNQPEEEKGSQRPKHSAKRYRPL